MKAKNIAILSYITIIGWVIAYFQYKGGNEKSELASYHLGQSLGLFILAVVLNVMLAVLGSIVPSLGTVFMLVGFLPLFLLIFGIIAAVNEARTPVPLLGKFFEEKINL